MLRFDAAVVRFLDWDERLCVAMNRALRYTAVTPFFRAVSWLGNGIFWYALTLAVLLHNGAGAVPAVLHMIIVGVVCTTIYKILNRGTLRPRPYEALQTGAPRANLSHNLSFPTRDIRHAR